MTLPLVHRCAGGITGEVTSGSVLAIMGPSGAGKTTLLNMLTLEKKGGVPRGKIELNGQPFTRSMYNKNCAYVQQEDSLWATFSSRDHLRYAFDLCQPHLSRSEKTAAIDTLIEAVGLTQAQHTKAGNAFVRGLSSGLKRRLSIAVALAKNPLVLFLDEPTSGIDSASAASMMTFLKEIATVQHLAIACTIHQPSASVFAGFDKTLILSDGRVGLALPFFSPDACADPPFSFLILRWPSQAATATPPSFSVLRSPLFPTDLRSPPFSFLILRWLSLA
jgi:ABC-type multidrug transport system ATPase subunit